MKPTYVHADRFYFPHECKEGGYLAITADGRFGSWQAERPQEEHELLDYRGFQLAPGYVDTHVHGFANADIMDGTEESVRKIAAGIPSTGVTSFLPTTLTSGTEELRQASAAVAAVAGTEEGARIQGIFFEGPYFTEKYKGAQNLAYMKDPDLEEFQAWQEAARGLIKKIALAPEREGVEPFIQAVTKEGVAVALGHSDASYAQAKAAVTAGASIWVHAYNGMRPLNHREPGMVGAVYNLPGTFAELICDGHHVSPPACEILLHQKTTENVLLITDCMRAGGCPDGDYHLGDFPVVVKEGTARLKEGGSLAGSILQLKDAVRNLVHWGLASPAEAIHMASYVPAASVHIEDRCGQIKEGLPADFLILDEDLDLVETYINGQSYYRKGGETAEGSAF